MATVLIVGASDRPERYSYKAYLSLREHGHEVILYSPRHVEIEGQKVFQSLADVPLPIDVMTLYVNPKISSDLMEDLIAINPRLTIFNPGAENQGLAHQLEIKKLKSIEACTLVLLSIGQFEKELALTSN